MPLVVSALVPSQRVDLAIDACRLARMPLKLSGPVPIGRPSNVAPVDDVTF
jgi:hypothetical protein